MAAPTTHRRSVLTLATAVAAVLAVAIVRPKTLHNLGMGPDSFWRAKLSWSHTSDLVLAGDSRVLEAVSPETMKRRLGAEREIVNYGFTGNCFTDDYLNAVEGLLRPGGNRPTIVLGITPNSLTRNACQTNGFSDLRKPAPAKNAFVARIDEQLTPFKPVRIKEIPSLFLSSNRLAQSHYYDYHPDGWVGAWQVPENPDEGPPYYRQLLDDNPVLPEIEERVVKAVARWHAAGTKVYGFRPPTTRDVIEVENQLGRFDESSFVTRFERAGGTWVRVAQTDYGSYDGSHLRKEEALRFTDDLAAQIAAR